MDPALPAGLVVPTYTPPVNSREREMTIEHTGHRFRDIFPTNLSTAWSAGSSLTYVGPAWVHTHKQQRLPSEACLPQVSTVQTSVGSWLIGEGGRKG